MYTVLFVIRWTMLYNVICKALSLCFEIQKGESEMENTAQDELLRQISDAVRTCGEIILHADRSKSCIDEKAGHANYVTAYDKKVQQELQRRLLDFLPLS